MHTTSGEHKKDVGAVCGGQGEFVSHDDEKSDETLESTRRMQELCTEAKVSLLLIMTRSLMRLWRAQEGCGSCVLRPR